MPHNPPWYKQFWPWFLIILPLTAVVASVQLLITAINHKDSLVSEDYYKEGKGINMDLRKIKQAKVLGMNYSLNYTDKHIILAQEGGTPYKAGLSVSFFHPTMASKDFHQVASADAKGNYHIDLAQPISGSWEIRIEGYDHTWRIQQKVSLQDNKQYWLN